MKGEVPSSILGLGSTYSSDLLEVRPLGDKVVRYNKLFAKVAQLVEHCFRKAGVPGSIPGFGSK